MEPFMTDSYEINCANNPRYYRKREGTTGIWIVGGGNLRDVSKLRRHILNNCGLFIHNDSCWTAEFPIDAAAIAHYESMHQKYVRTNLVTYLMKKLDVPEIVFSRPPEYSEI